MAEFKFEEAFPVLDDRSEEAVELPVVQDGPMIYLAMPAGEERELAKAIPALMRFHRVTMRDPLRLTDASHQVIDLEGKPFFLAWYVRRTEQWEQDMAEVTVEREGFQQSLQRRVEKLIRNRPILPSVDRSAVAPRHGFMGPGALGGQG